MNILFMCVANSARSQLAEGIAKSIFGDKAWIESAGSMPKTVNPYAVEVLKEIGIDISKNYSKTYDEVSPKFIVGLNYIITLCAEEVCPTMVSRSAEKLHWGFEDPAGKPGDRDVQLKYFRETRDAIQSKIKAFAKDLETMR